MFEGVRGALELLESKRANPCRWSASWYTVSRLKEEKELSSFFCFQVWLATSWLYGWGGWSVLARLDSEVFCLTTISVWSEKVAVAVGDRFLKHH